MYSIIDETTSGQHSEEVTWSDASNAFEHITDINPSFFDY